jgi:hypothetical protein
LDLPSFACVNPSFARKKISGNIIDFMFRYDMACVVRDKAEAVYALVEFTLRLKKRD